MLTTLGAALGVVLAVLAILGAAWRWVVLPNLREQLIRPLDETRRQVTENAHRNPNPTVMDRLDDVETSVDDVRQALEAIGLNQTAILRRLGQHIGESAQDRAELWLNVDRLHQRKRTGRKQHGKQERGDTGGA